MAGVPGGATATHLHVPARGTYELHLIASAAVPGMLALAAAGDPLVTKLLNAVIDAVQEIDRAPAEQPKLCISCPRPVKDRPFTCAVCLPTDERTPRAIGFAICGTCASTFPAARAKAFEGLRRLWPDVRAIDPFQHEAGHA